jgi:radical SAM superfamily enzyme YgiQ (UPF0313 family)
VFPLGLAHLSAALREAGHEVSWLDLLTEGDRFEELLQANAPELVGISVRNIDDVLIRKQQSFVDNLGELVQTIHEELGSPVVLGGSGFSILPRELLKTSGADFGVVGEGETALPALIAALDTGESYTGIPGLVFRQCAGIALNEPARPSATDQTPEADLPPQIIAQYLRRGGVLNLQTQRGCAHRCCYCTYPVIEGTRHRSRSSEAVVSEFERLERLGADYAFVVDSVFNSSESHVSQICEALVRRGLKIRWGCFLRPQGLTHPMVRLMAKAGLAHVEFGSDSFCDEVLCAYQKDFTFEDIRLSTELVRNEDIDFCHFVIAGGPGETPQTLQLGFKNSQVLGSPIIMAVPGMRIYPGTRLFDLAVGEGRLPPASNLLKPAYYLAAGLNLELVLETLKGFAAQWPNWVVGDFDPDYEGLVARLRQRGVTGPLWSYFATAQRLWPRASGGSGS